VLVLLFVYSCKCGAIRGALLRSLPQVEVAAEKRSCGGGVAGGS